jgi:hypothetical protein
MSLRKKLLMRSERRGEAEEERLGQSIIWRTAEESVRASQLEKVTSRCTSSHRPSTSMSAPESELLGDESNERWR